MKKNSPRQYAIAFYEATKSVKGDDLKAIIANFARLIAKERQIKLSGRIIDEFVNYSKEKAGVEKIEIFSASKLDQKTIDAIKKVFGDSVESTEQVDESLIGGIIVKTKKHILDGSVRTQLIKLKQQLI
jgi:F-type H+-transporting ATPase subunit delta